MLISMTVFLIKSEILNSLAGHMNTLRNFRKIMRKKIRIEVLL